MTLPWAEPRGTTACTRPGFLLPLENTGTLRVLRMPALRRSEPPTLVGLPVMNPGETSRFFLSLRTSSVMFWLPPASLLTSSWLLWPETLVKAQPVGFCDQFDQVSAAPEVMKPPGPVNSTRPDQVPHPAKSPTLAVHLPAIGFFTVMLSAVPGPPASTSPVVSPFGSVSDSVQSPTASLP